MDNRGPALEFVAQKILDPVTHMNSTSPPHTPHKKKQYKGSRHHSENQLIFFSTPYKPSVETMLSTPHKPTHTLMSPTKSTHQFNPTQNPLSKTMFQIISSVYTLLLNRIRRSFFIGSPLNATHHSTNCSASSSFDPLHRNRLHSSNNSPSSSHHFRGF